MHCSTPLLNPCDWCGKIGPNTSAREALAVGCRVLREIGSLRSDRERAAPGERAAAGADQEELRADGMIVEALKTHRGVVAKGARQLGLTERIMGLRVKKHAIALGCFKTTAIFASDSRSASSP